MQLFSAKCMSQARLDGKTVIVTGCNTGIGKETVLDFFKRGGKIIMACRDTTKAEIAKSDIENRTNGQSNLGELVVKELDLSSLKSIRAFAAEVTEQEAQINILVNNAGVMACPQGKTEDGFEVHMGTNHLGHFLLTLLLLPKMIKSAPARIVTVSSLLHKDGDIDLEDLHCENRPYNAWYSYCHSKLANVMFTKVLSNKLKDNGIHNVTCYSLHPGVIATDISRHFDWYMFRGMIWVWNNVIGSLFLKTPEQGAQTTIYCSVDENCSHESGLYYAECAVTNTHVKAEDEEVAKKLWDLSVKLVKLEDYEPFKTSK